MNASLDSFRGSDLSRVVVVGTSCAGKTAYARQLSRALDVPHIELDGLYWLPDWIPRPEAEFRALVREALARDTWIVDGNYTSYRDLIWPRATAVIWLNYSFARIAWRGLRRTVRRAVTKEELFSGNRETIAQSFFSRESVLVWLVRTYGKNKRRYRSLFDERTYPALAMIEFRTPGEAARSLTLI